MPMTGRRVLVLAIVTDICDHEVTYPSCQQCYSKLFLDQLAQNQKYHCLKCGWNCDAGKEQWRYRLVLSVADSHATGRVVVFGSTLNDFFGKTATDFHRSVQELSKSSYPAESMVTDALFKRFMGKYFYFGFKAAGIRDQSQTVSLGDVLQPTDTQHNSDTSHTLVYQMIANNDGVYATVADHIRFAVKALKKYGNISAVNISKEGRATEVGVKHQRYSHAESDSDSSSVCGTSSLYAKQTSVRFSFEQSSRSVCNTTRSASVNRNSSHKLDRNNSKDGSYLSDYRSSFNQVTCENEDKCIDSDNNQNRHVTDHNQYPLQHRIEFNSQNEQNTLGSEDVEHVSILESQNQDSMVIYCSDTSETCGSVESKEIRSAYEIHRHLGPPCSHITECEQQVEDYFGESFPDNSSFDSYISQYPYQDKYGQVTDKNAPLLSIIDADIGPEKQHLIQANCGTESVKNIYLPESEDLYEFLDSFEEEFEESDINTNSHEQNSVQDPVLATSSKMDCNDVIIKFHANSNEKDCKTKPKDKSSDEHSNVLSAHEVHRNLEPCCSQPVKRDYSSSNTLEKSHRDTENQNLMYLPESEDLEAFLNSFDESLVLTDSMCNAMAMDCQLHGDGQNVNGHDLDNHTKPSKTDLSKKEKFSTVEHDSKLECEMNVRTDCDCSLSVDKTDCKPSLPAGRPDCDTMCEDLEDDSGFSQSVDFTVQTEEDTCAPGTDRETPEYDVNTSKSAALQHNVIHRLGCQQTVGDRSDVNNDKLVLQENSLCRAQWNDSENTAVNGKLTLEPQFTKHNNKIKSLVSQENGCNGSDESMVESNKVLSAYEIARVLEPYRAKKSRRSSDFSQDSSKCLKHINEKQYLEEKFSSQVEEVEKFLADISLENEEKLTCLIDNDRKLSLVSTKVKREVEIVNDSCLENIPKQSPVNVHRYRDDVCLSQQFVNGDIETSFSQSEANHRQNISRGECNKVLSAYEIHRHLEPCCTHPTRCDESHVALSPSNTSHSYTAKPDVSNSSLSHYQNPCRKSQGNILYGKEGEDKRALDESADLFTDNSFFDHISNSAEISCRTVSQSDSSSINNTKIIADHIIEGSPDGHIDLIVESQNCSEYDEKPSSQCKENFLTHGPEFNKDISSPTVNVGRRVQFDRRLQKVSNCQLMDLKMKLNDSPLENLGKTRLPKSCLKSAKRAGNLDAKCKPFSLFVAKQEEKIRHGNGLFRDVIIGSNTKKCSKFVETTFVDGSQDLFSSSPSESQKVETNCTCVMTKEATSWDEHNKVLSAYEFHRHLEPCYAQPTTCLSMERVTGCLADNDSTLGTPDLFEYTMDTEYQSQASIDTVITPDLFSQVSVGPIITPDLFSQTGSFLYPDSDGSKENICDKNKGFRLFADTSTHDNTDFRNKHRVTGLVGIKNKTDQRQVRNLWNFLVEDTPAREPRSKHDTLNKVHVWDSDTSVCSDVQSVNKAVLRALHDNTSVQVSPDLFSSPVLQSCDSLNEACMVEEDTGESPLCKKLFF